MTWYALLKAVHVLSAVVWVGGMVFAHLVLRPSLAVLEPPARMALMRDVLRRFFLIVWHAMPLMILTGFAIIFGVAGGMAGVRWNVHVMLLLGLIMSGIFVVIFFGPWRAFRAAPGPDTLASIRRLVGINMILGLLTVLIGVLG
jgi:uncharacterized membrane protein